jgi:hypothetical protein
MLCGRPPFSPDLSEFVLRKAQVDAPPPPLRALLPQAPFVLDPLFARALAKDPAQRFASAIEMGDAFRMALGLPETPEWLAQADLARAAKTIGEADTEIPPAASEQRKLATLREFVAHGYKTQRMASR